MTIITDKTLEFKDESLIEIGDNNYTDDSKFIIDMVESSLDIEDYFNQLAKKLNQYRLDVILKGDIENKHLTRYIELLQYFKCKLYAVCLTNLTNIAKNADTILSTAKKYIICLDDYIPERAARQIVDPEWQGSKTEDEDPPLIEIPATQINPDLINSASEIKSLHPNLDLVMACKLKPGQIDDITSMLLYYEHFKPNSAIFFDEGISPPTLVFKGRDIKAAHFSLDHLKDTSPNFYILEGTGSNSILLVEFSQEGRITKRSFKDVFSI
jgi:hypothetical protein